MHFAAFLYSRKLIVIRVGSTEPREPVNEARTPRVLRGFSPHLVADDDIINGCCGRILRDRGPIVSPARAMSAPRTRLHHDTIFRRDVSPRACARRAAMRSYPLLHPRSGRHDLDEMRSCTPLCTSASRQSDDVAVKNLRNNGSAVLQLNFREVGLMRLCSTGVTV